METGDQPQNELALSSFHRQLFRTVNDSSDGPLSKRVHFEHRVKEDLGDIASLSVSSDGSLLAYASNGLIVVHDLKEEAEILRYEISSAKATSVQLSRTGDLLAIGTTGGEAIVYDVRNMRVDRIYNHKSPVNHASLSEGGDILAVASGVRVLVYSNDTGILVREIVCNSTAESVCFHSGTGIFIERSNAVELWDFSTGENKGTFADCAEADLSRPLAGVNHLLFKSIGKDALLWDYSTGEVLRRFNHKAKITAVAFAAFPRKVFITADDDGETHVYDASADGHPVALLNHSFSVQAVDMTADGRRIFSGSDAVRVWEMEEKKCVKTIRGYGSQVVACCLLRDERRILIGGGDGVAKMYDLDTGRAVRRFEGHNGCISDIAVCEDLKMAVTTGHDGTACAFSLSGDLIHRLNVHRECLHAVALCPANRTIATGGRESTVSIWEIGNGRLKSSWKAHNGWVRSLSFSRDGKYLLSSGNDGMARMWESSTGALIAEYGFHSEILYSAVFSHDGRFIATAGQDSTLKIFDREGRVKREIRGHVGGVRKVIFHNDGSLLSVGQDCTARRWDPETGECLMVYRDLHSDWIRSVSATSNGVLLLGSKDGTLSFSDLETGKRLATLHNLDRGFLWTSPAEKDSDPGWFWTDREELIEVMEVDRDGGSVLFATDSRDRKDHISFCNSMTRVMSRIRNKGRDGNRFERLTAMHRECLEKERHAALLPYAGFRKD